MNPATGSELPTVTSLIAPLVDVDDRGVYFEDTFTSWRAHIANGAAVAAALRARMDPERPPHVGVLLQNTPFFSSVLVAAGLTGIVPVGPELGNWLTEHGREALGGRPFGDGTPPPPPKEAEVVPPGHGAAA